jgi:hypothetical protein
MPAREIYLPAANRELELYRVHPAVTWPLPDKPIESRVAFAAAHVVVDPLADGDPPTSCTLDWEATLAYRRVLWSYGLALAEAMDTSQRGMGLDWPTAQELIRRSVAEAKAHGGRIASGAGTDHLPPGQHALGDVLAAYEQQCEFVESCGSQIILMASRALAASARSAEDYARIYGRILSQVQTPVILHWLGEMFDPALVGYWGTRDVRKAMGNCLSVIHGHPAKVDGIKISLLDAELEIEMRRELPDGVRMYTGDDFGYDALILGDEQGHSDALLGIFDAIAPAASMALQCLDKGDAEEFGRILKPTIPLSRTIFSAPTYSYKTGIVFLAWLNGYQRHFRMVAAKESARNILHLSDVFRLANEAGLLIDPELATSRMRTLLTLSGI